MSKYPPSRSSKFFVSRELWQDKYSSRWRNGLALYHFSWDEAKRVLIVRTDYHSLPTKCSALK